MRAPTGPPVLSLGIAVTQKRREIGIYLGIVGVELMRDFKDYQGVVDITQLQIEICEIVGDGGIARRLCIEIAQVGSL